MCNYKLDKITATAGNKTQTFEVNSHTPYGEPQIWIQLSNDTALEITDETDTKNNKPLYSMLHHCSSDDFDNNKYATTMGIITTNAYSTIPDLEDGLSKFLENMAIQNIHII